MATYYLDKQLSNNMERGAGTSVLYLPSEIDGKLLEDGDIILIGGVPRESFTTKGILDIVDKFATGAAKDVEFEIGHPTYDSAGNISGINVFDTLDAVVHEPKAIKLPTAIKYSDGTDAGGVISAWNGGVDILVRITIGTGSLVKGGLVRFIFDYNYFGTATGKYAEGYIPISVY